MPSDLRSRLASTRSRLRMYALTVAGCTAAILANRIALSAESRPILAKAIVLNVS